MELTLARIDRWLEAHLDWIAAGLVTGGFVIRLVLAATTWLNSDEIIHFMAGDQPRLALAAEQGLTCQHPPLHYWLIYFWRYLGRSDLMLRLPSVLMGTAYIWVAYKWLSEAWGKTTGLVGLGLMTFAPELILRSKEVRGYVILLLLVIGAVACLETALRRKSVRLMIVSTFLLLLALLTDFSAFLTVFALGLFALAYVIAYRPGARLTVVWIAGQLAVLGLALLLYKTQIVHLQGFGAQQFAREGWGRNIYFHPGSDNALLFALQNTLSLFHYIFSSPLLGLVGVPLFVAALITLFFLPRPAVVKPPMHADERQREESLDHLRQSALIGGSNKRLSQKARREERLHGLLFLLPIFVALAAALTGLTPYGGTRHSIVPAVFGLLGIACLLGRWAGTRLTLTLLAVLALGPLWTVLAQPIDAYISPANQNRRQMTEAIDYLRGQMPGTGLIFCDDQSQALLLHYLCQGHGQHAVNSPLGFIEYDCARFRLVSPVTWTFSVDGEDDPFTKAFAGEFFRFEEAYDLRPGDSVSAFAAGWNENLVSQMSRRFAVDYPGLRRFGGNISVFFIPAGDERHMAVQADRKARTEQALAQLAAQATGSTALLLWPTWYLGDNARRSTGRVESYAEFYKQFTPDRRLSELLPARALWVFGTAERHTRALRHMDDRESFTVGDYDFVLLGTDPESLAAIYEIRQH